MLDTINADLKAAMIARDELKKLTLQGLKSAIKYGEIDAGHTFDDAEVTKLIMKEAKKRRESIVLYVQGGNQQSADQEQAELEILEAYLPEMASEEDVKAAVAAAVESTGAKDMKDMGKVMGAVKGKLGDSVDGALIAKFAKEMMQ